MHNYNSTFKRLFIPIGTGMLLRIFFLLIIIILPAKIICQNNFVYVQDGRLYSPDGEELALFGVNLQSMISWEYNSKMKDAGIPKDAAIWKEMTDRSLDELEIMGANYIRVHLTPADFTDANGNLIQTIYLDLLDYTTAEAAKRGMRVCYAFLNHMGSYEVASSFMRSSFNEARSISIDDDKLYQRNLLMFDEDYKTASKNYIENLLKRVNPYTNTAYKSDTSIIAWGIMNEPIFMDYTQLKLYTAEYEKFKTWLTDNSLTESNGINYPAYRKQRLKAYINEIYEVVRNTGSVQPVEWSLNWHRFRIGREDVFEAVAESDVEVVAFCTYPGQSVATQLGGGNYANFDGDLSSYDFSDWFQDAYNEISWYAWTLSSQFSSKAKMIYEFEGFYNQSSYIYPAMADLQRALGAQAAAMWHYSQPDYAQYNSGSHILNLKCTPNKAAGFAVASKIFQNTVTQQTYHPNSPLEYQADNYMYSFTNDIAVYSDHESYFYSASVSPGQSPAPPYNVKHIMGIGNSDLVEYSGNGNYLIDIVNDTMLLSIQPDVSYNYSLSSREDAPITNLHYDTLHTLNLKFWDRYGMYELQVLEDNMYHLSQTAFYLNNLNLTPGKYRISLADTLYTPETETPTAPGNLSVENIKPSKVDLRWTASSNAYIDKYKVYINGELDTLISAPDTIATIDGLSCGESYNFAVKAISGAGNESPLSSIATVTTDSCDLRPPTAPTELYASNISANSIHLSWRQASDNVDVFEYIIYEKGEEKARILHPATTALIKALFCGSTYEFVVKAIDEAGNISAASNKVIVNTLDCSGLINFEEWWNIGGWSVTDLTSYSGFPDNPDTTGYLNSLQIPSDYSTKAYGLRIRGSLIAPETGTYYFWIASDNAGQLWLSTNNTAANRSMIAYNNTWTSFQEWNKSASQKSSGRTLVKGKKYYIEVLLKADEAGDHISVGWRKPSDGAGNEPMEIIPGSALAPLSDHEAPSAPSGLSASNISATSFDLSWDESNDNSEIAGYYVFQDNIIIDTLSTTVINISGLLSGFSYDFKIKAIDIYGNISDASTVKTIVTIDDEAPTIPGKAIALEISGTSVKLSWDASSDNAYVSAYDVYMNGSLEQTVSDTFCIVSGLKMATSYTVSVSAKDAAGNQSAKSANLLITTLDTEAPTTPENLTASNITGNSCMLGWSASTDNVGIETYQVFKDGVLEIEVWTTYVAISDLENGSTYEFTVKAVDAAGNESEASSALLIETLDTEAPNAPANLLASNITETTIDLSWEASTDNVEVAGYDVIRDNELDTMVTSTMVTIDDLDDGITYLFTVRAKDRAGNLSDESSDLEVTTADSVKTGIQGINVSEKIQYYPNPVIDKFYITNAENGVIRIYDINGRMVVKSYHIAGKAVDISFLPQGIYVLRLTDFGKSTRILKCKTE